MKLPFKIVRRCQTEGCDKKAEYRIGLTSWFCEEHYKRAGLIYIRERKKIDELDDKAEEEFNRRHR